MARVSEYWSYSLQCDYFDQQLLGRLAQQTKEADQDSPSKVLELIKREQISMEQLAGG